MNSGWNGTPQNTTKMAGTHLASGADLAPDDSLLDLRDISVQEIFALVWQAPQGVMKSEERGIHERLASGGAEDHRLYADLLRAWSRTSRLRTRWPTGQDNC